LKCGTIIFALAVLLPPMSSHAQTASAELPLLGSSHARSVLVDFCEGKDDQAELPLDPRRLVQPGVNEGRFVKFNVWWDDCHVNNAEKQPQTCGELRSRAARGGDYIALHHMPHDIIKISAGQYESLWQVWGLSAKPMNYEAEVRERYGLAAAAYRNPYPLSGEDPNATGGGSGQLPLGLVQVSQPDGHYTGEVTLNCLTCHSSSVGSPDVDGGPGAVIGMGNASLDAQLLMDELALGLPLPIPLSSTRGTTNAEGLSELLFSFRDLHSMDPAIKPLRSDVFHSNGGDTDMPPWWNLSHRPRKFHDAGLSSDDGRMAVLLWYAADPFTYPGAKIRATDAEADAVQAWFDTLKAPSYPYGFCTGPSGARQAGEGPECIDKPMAEQGAMLFHTRSLFSDPPAGNGSCASCHGVYSPRYANDPAFLEDPRLAGMSAYVSKEVATDPARSGGMPMSLRKTLSVAWTSYPEGQPGYVAPEDKDPLTEFLDDYQFAGSDEGLPSVAPGEPFGVCTWEMKEIGYQAPPLHGIWASAPYFHNGSVPDVWGVLDPAKRPAIWRRPSTTGPTFNHGFDTSLAAYDTERLGWKYTELTCSNDASVPYLACDPGNAPLDPIVETAFGASGSTVTVGYVATPANSATVELRKIFNTRMFGKGNQGHWWTSVLSDDERRALIEYLKTL